MALSEEQIQRYSRQILLREVGGRGQQTLLSTRVALRGEGAALATAAAYVAGSGISLAAPHRPARDEERGFLISSAAVGQPLEAVLASYATNGSPSIVLAALPALLEDPSLAWVAIAEEGVVSRTATGCAACFAQSLEGWHPPTSGARSVALGAAAALVVQRVALARSESVGVLELSPAGTPTAAAVRRCPAHA